MMKTAVNHYRLVEDATTTDGGETYNLLTLMRLDDTIEREAIVPRGGITVFSEYNDDGTLSSRGISVCSIHDNYDKSRGRKIAEFRAKHGYKDEGYRLPTFYREYVSVPEEVSEMFA